MLTEASTGLAAAVAASPDDAELRLVFADSLEESGEGSKADWHRAVAGVLRATSAGERELAKAMLSSANGRRQVRTLEWTDVLDCCVKSMRSSDGWHAVGGGYVSNSYGYQSQQTVCLAARRTDDTLRVAIAVTSASKGSSLTTATAGLRKNAKPEEFRQWADSQK